MTGDYMRRERLELGDEALKHISHIMFIEDFIRTHNKTETFRDAADRFLILSYEMGDIARQIIYKRRDKDRYSHDEMVSAFADTIVMLFSLANFCGVDMHEATKMGILRLLDDDWRKH